MANRLELAPRSLPIAAGDTIYDVSYSPTAIGGYKFCAVGGYGGSPEGKFVLGSNDGVTWTKVNTGPSAAYGLYCVTNDGTNWIIGGQNTSAKAYVWYTSNLSSYINGISGGTANNAGSYSNLDFDGTRLVATGSAGAFAAGSTPPVISEYQEPVTGNAIYDAAGNVSRTIILHSDGTAWYIDNGVWTTKTQITTLPAGVTFSRIEWNGSYWLAIAIPSASNPANRIYTSTDGLSWDLEAGFDLLPVPPRSSEIRCADWDSGQNKWLIGAADYLVFEGSGSRQSLSFEETQYTAGFAQPTTKTDFYGLYNVVAAPSDSKVVFVGRDSSLSSGSWVSDASPWATNPSPSYQLLEQVYPTVARSPSLSWSGGSGTVYLGKTPETLVSQGSQSSPWSPSTLDAGETYYWRVDIGGVQGNLWRFYTDRGRFELSSPTIPGTTYQLYGCGAYPTVVGGARFVVTGFNYIWYSTDGVNWSSSPLPSSYYVGFEVLCDGTDWWIAGRTQGTVVESWWRSTDVTTGWTSSLGNGSPHNGFGRGIAWDGSSTYMAFGDGLNTPGTGGSSTDHAVLAFDTGSGWSFQYPNTPGTNPFASIYAGAANGSGRFVIGKIDGEIWYTDNAGTSWTAASSPPTGNGSIWKIRWNGSYFLAIVDRSPSNFVTLGNLRRMIDGDGRQAREVWTSTDGSTWVKETGWDLAAARWAGRLRNIAWDSSQSVWIGVGNELACWVGSGSQGSLSFEEYSYGAGFTASRNTTGSEYEAFEGVGVANNTVVAVGYHTGSYQSKVVSGTWNTSDNWATNPSPAHQPWGSILPGNTGKVSKTTSLSWSGGSGTVYFGKNPESLASQGSQSSPWSPGTLDDNETYYWRVDIGGVQGNLWRFYTEPADTSEKLHTHQGTYNVWSGSYVTVNATDPWADRITFAASGLTGGHRYLVSMSTMSISGGGGAYEYQLYAIDSNGREHYFDNDTHFYVSPYNTTQNKCQTIVVLNPGEDLRLRIKGLVSSVNLCGTWITLIDLDSPGMIQGVDWNYKKWNGVLTTDNTSANDSYPVIDLEWTPDGESDYVVWAGAFWDSGKGTGLCPHGYRFRDRDTDVAFALNNITHGSAGALSYLADGAASMQPFKKPPSSLKRLRMDLWGYGAGSEADEWRARDATAVWFRVSKMRSYAIDDGWGRKPHFSGTSAGSWNGIIAHYSADGAQPLNSVSFRPDDGGAAVFFCYLHGVPACEFAGSFYTEASIGAIMSWGDYSSYAGYDNIWSTTRGTPTREQEFASYDLHRPYIGSTSWYSSTRGRDALIGQRRRSGLSSETRDIHLWWGKLNSGTYHQCNVHNVAAFGELYADAGATPGIQQVVPTPGKRAVPHNEPITFKLASENGADVDLVRIKERWNPQKPVVMGGDAQTDGAGFYSVASNGAGVLVASSGNGKGVYRSTDGGNTWTRIALTLIGAAALQACRQIIWNPNISKFVGINDDGIVYYSTDATGATWGEVDTTGRYQYGIAQNSSGRMVVTDYDGHLFWSDDGTSWTKLTSVGTRFYGVACNGTLFVAVGGNNEIFTSTDGTSWTSRTSPNSGYYKYDIAYGNGIFVAVDYYYSEIITSTDGINWTARDLGHEFGPYRVDFGNGEFLMQGGGGMGAMQDRSWARDGRLMASTDGINWERIGYITDNEEKNGWVEGDYNGLYWEASWAAGSWWISAGRPRGAMIKTSDKLLGTTWENVIVNNVFQSGWDGAGSGITTTGMPAGTSKVSIDPGSKLKFWTNYLIEVQASDSVSGTPMDDYQWSFNTWGERLQVFNRSANIGTQWAAGITQYDMFYAPSYSTYDPYYKWPELWLPTKMFTTGHRYLVLGSVHSSGSNEPGPIWRLYRDGNSNADTKITGFYDYDEGQQHHFMRMYDDIKEDEKFELWARSSLSPNTSRRPYVRHGYLNAIDLDSPGMQENINWWYDEDLTYVADVPNNWNTSFAEVTFDAISGEDYLVIACCQMRNSNNYPNSAFRIYDVTGGAEVARGGYRPYTNQTDVEHCHVTAGVVTPASTGAHTVRVDMRGGGYFDHNFSSIFVLHLGSFKTYAFVDNNSLSVTGFPKKLYPDASGDPTPRANVTIPGDAFGEIFAIPITGGYASNVGNGLLPSTMLNDGRFADLAREFPGNQNADSWSCLGRANPSTQEGFDAAVLPNIQYGSIGDNDLSTYLSAVNTADELTRAAIFAFGTEPGEPPDVPVDLDLDPINTASSLGDITPDVSSPIPEPDIPDFPRTVFSDPGAPGVKLELLEPTAQTTDQLEIADRTHFTLVTTPTLDDLGVPPGDTGGTVRLGLLPGDKIVLSGTGPNDGVTYTIKDGNALEVLEEINDWDTDTATYDFVAYRRK